MQPHADANVKFYQTFQERAIFAPPLCGASVVVPKANTREKSIFPRTGFREKIFPNVKNREKS